MDKPVVAKVILQQCVSAKLQTKPATEETVAEFAEIGRGVVMYVCLMKGSSENTVKKIAQTAFGVKLSRTADGKLVSVMDLPGDVLVVPQATLGGKLKGKSMQYHSNVEKSTGLLLYEQLKSHIKETFPQGCVKFGTYGNLQVLKMDTNGPFTHLIDIVE